VYGHDPGLPKVEERVDKPLSPHAATKAVDEVYAIGIGETWSEAKFLVPIPAQTKLSSAAITWAESRWMMI
jgi:hypothetical protein